MLTGVHGAVIGYVELPIPTQSLRVLGLEYSPAPTCRLLLGLLYIKSAGGLTPRDTARKRPAEPPLGEQPARRHHKRPCENFSVGV